MLHTTNPEILFLKQEDVVKAGLLDMKQIIEVTEKTYSMLGKGHPDDFVFPVSDAQAYHQLGNSVSVPIIKMIMKNMIEAYEKSLKK